MKRYFKIIEDGKELYYHTNSTSVVVVSIEMSLSGREVIECHTFHRSGELLELAPMSSDIPSEVFLAAYHKFENRCKEIINSTGL
jgi:hypothetical protein